MPCLISAAGTARGALKARVLTVPAAARSIVDRLLPAGACRHPKHKTYDDGPPNGSHPARNFLTIFGWAALPASANQAISPVST